MVSDSFWRGRRVLVTGHTGFKGGWLSIWLQALGAEVSGFSLAPPTQPSLYETADVERGMSVTTGDVRDLDAVRACMEREKPEVVMHLAAQSLVRRSYADPVETYATNVMGTVNVLEAVRSSPGVRAALVVTSDKCYENREWVWGYRENEPMGGHDPYSNSKGCAELVTAAYRGSFFGAHTERPLLLASARAGNVIGGGDWAEDRLVPDAVRAFLRAEPLVIRSPNAIRPWQHVLEPLEGYLRLARRMIETGGHAEGWNFGAGDQDSRPVSWVVDRLVEHWGEGARWELDDRAQPHEARLLKLDSSKARAELGWESRLPLDEALAWTVEWYRAFHEGGNLRQVTEAQIARYQDRITA
jgi:CDP-glucose 4,6-dehydratase